MRYSFIVLAVLCAIGIPQACLSSDLFIETGPDVRHTAGDSTYHISFDEPWALGGHGESELEFPINNVMAGINVIVGTKYGKNSRKSKGRLCLRLLGTIDEDAGIMKDSDWIENDAAFGKYPSCALKLKPLASSLFSVDLRYIENITTRRQPVICKQSVQNQIDSKLGTTCQS